MVGKNCEHKHSRNRTTIILQVLAFSISTTYTSTYSTIDIACYKLMHLLIRMGLEGRAIYCMYVPCILKVPRKHKKDGRVYCASVGFGWMPVTCILTTLGSMSSSPSDLSAKFCSRSVHPSALELQLNCITQ